MAMTFPMVDAQQLYRQWQDGKLLDNDERIALRTTVASDPNKSRFADLLKSVSERDS
ncbi:MAG TPA: hypothetical protein VIR57_10515 [Chloroflexota bacterium]|jgi:hypothetical protein